MRLAWQQIPSTIITEMFCNTEFDGVVLDLEHGTFNVETMFSCIQVARLKNKKVFVRVPDLDKRAVRVALDADASGIIHSTVETFDQAEQFYNYCVYPYEQKLEEFKSDDRGVIRKTSKIKTTGSRGQGLVRENSWGAKKLNQRKPLIIAQIETQTGVDNLSTISTLPFDYYLVGPYDLSASLNVLGDFKNLKYISAIDKIKKVIGDKIGIHVPSNIENMDPSYKDYKFLALGMDTTFIRELSERVSSI